MSSQKIFYCIQFCDGTTNVIPEEWMLSKNRCLWPKNSAAKIDEIAQQRITPQDSWKAYKCKILDKSRKFLYFLKPIWC